MKSPIEKEIHDILAYLESIDPTKVHFLNCDKVEKYPVHKMEKHSHDFFEFFYFLDGRGQIRTPDKTLHVSHYDMIVFPPGVSHEEFSDTIQPEELIFICASIPTTQSYQASFQMRDLEGNLQWLFTQVLSEFRSKRSFSQEVIQRYLESILYLIKRYYKSYEPRPLDSFEFCLRYIHDHFQESLTLDHLASLCYMSQSYLSRVFKKQIAMSPMKYLSLVRIEKSKEFLHREKLSVRSAAFRVGFEDYHYFCRVFKKITGITPSEYKDSIK